MAYFKSGMTVNELIAELTALPPETRALKVITHNSGGTDNATEVMTWHVPDAEAPAVWIGS